MNIHIKDPQSLLSQTQKQKLRKFVRSLWEKDEEDFINHVDEVLNSIHYPPTSIKYNEMKFDHDKTTNILTIDLSYRDPEEHHNQLKMKLKNKIKNLKDRRFSQKTTESHQDPAEQMYQTLRNGMPAGQQSMLPSPTQIRANPQMYQAMMSMIPNQNPIYKYLTMFFPTM